MQKLISIILLTFALTGCDHITNSSNQSFFENHGLLVLMGWALFPRIMFLFFSAISGGFFFWVGALLTPRIMVAYWATQYYWHSNPILCVLAWFIAFSGEGAEKSLALK